MKKKTIILGISGGIAAYKSCELINLYRKSGFEVICLLTKEALNFVTPLTLETLSGNKVISDMFSLPVNRKPVHTSLADKADLIVVLPATMNIIGKLASGICDDILTCTIFATEAPVLIAPAMNDKMYKNKINQRNIDTLKKVGYKFIGPSRGHLACGYEGIGHIADIKDVFKESNKLLK